MNNEDKEIVSTLIGALQGMRLMLNNNSTSLVGDELRKKLLDIINTNLDVATNISELAQYPTLTPNKLYQHTNNTDVAFKPTSVSFTETNVNCHGNWVNTTNALHYKIIDRDYISIDKVDIDKWVEIEPKFR